jgi:ATP-dependent DNA helicase RecG
MNRLVEGDVGSGKTVVATMAAVMALQQGFQVAFMAPTELLARQHAETIYSLLDPLGMAGRLSLLIGGLKPAQKKAAQARIKSGEISFIIGTHALIQEKVDMHKLGLIIVDEQHRFGVDQRKALQAKAGHMPHVLSMTATPIPRSLALTLYGELDISVIDVKPAGRKPIITKIISPNSRKQLYEKVDEQITAGRQVFVVTPLISESEALPAKSAEEVYESLRKGVFKHRRVGLLHGKLKPDEKDAIMQQFVRHELDILVSTTVIEVGVNVPNATVMLIENAERFGLAQIHQLRGRFGRSEEQGYCYLIMGDSSEPSRRLRALESSSDGFALAELDLEIRGPGAIYGTQQHGQLDLRIAKLTDTQLIASARQTAQNFIDRGEDLLQYEELAEQVARLRAVTNLN